MSDEWKRWMVASVLVLGASSLACGSLGDDPKSKCQECTIDSDCKDDLVCTCVYDEGIDNEFCSACAPEEYEILQGEKQDETYRCDSVDEE